MLRSPSPRHRPAVPSGPVTASTGNARPRPFWYPRLLSVSTPLCRDAVNVLKCLSRCFPALFFGIPISGGRDKRRVHHPGRLKTRRLEAPDRARWRFSPRDELGRHGLREPVPPGLLPWKASSENKGSASQVHLSCLWSPEKATGSPVFSQVYLGKR